MTRTKPKYTSKELIEIIHMMAEDLGIDRAEFTGTSKMIDVFLLSYLLANVSDIEDLWNDEDE